MVRVPRNLDQLLTHGHQAVFDRQVSTLPAERIHEIKLLPDQDETDLTAQPYADAVMAEHADTQADISSKIEQGILAESHALPALSSSQLNDKFLDLRTIYDSFNEAGLRPRPIFFLRGLNLAQWNVLIAGRQIPYAAQTLGRHVFIDRAYREPVKSGVILPETTGDIQHGQFLDGAFIPGQDRDSQEADILSGPRTKLAKGEWDLGIISEKNGVTEGVSTRATTESISRVSTLLGGRLLFSPEMPFSQRVLTLSPSSALYAGLQLSRLRRGLKPVDISTSSFLKEHADQDASLAAGWDLESASIALVAAHNARRLPGYGLRPSITSADLGNFI